jgi:regulator of protease activity HflC (stomatin/prohibitin superfamily)
MAVLVTVVVALVLLAMIVFAMSLRIVKQYEAGVLFRLGRVIGVRQPGLTSTPSTPASSR